MSSDPAKELEIRCLSHALRNYIDSMQMISSTLRVVGSRSSAAALLAQLERIADLTCDAITRMDGLLPEALTTEPEQPPVAPHDDDDDHSAEIHWRP